MYFKVVNWSDVHVCAHNDIGQLHWPHLTLQCIALHWAVSTVKKHSTSPMRLLYQTLSASLTLSLSDPLSLCLSHAHTHFLFLPHLISLFQFRGFSARPTRALQRLGSILETYRLAERKHTCCMEPYYAADVSMDRHGGTHNDIRTEECKVWMCNLLRN